MIACCSLRVPAVGVYFVWPALIAASAASLMFCGVSKSGSPAPRSTTSMPSARIASAACIAASVDEAFISATRSETGNLELTVMATIIFAFLCVFAPLRESNHAMTRRRKATQSLFLLPHSLFNQRRHQSLDVCAQLKYFLHQTRAYIRVSLSRHHEYSLETRFKPPVHQGHLQFKFVIRNGANAADDRMRFAFGGVLHQQPLETVDDDFAAALLNIFQYLSENFLSLLDREERGLVRID